MERFYSVQNITGDNKTKKFVFNTTLLVFVFLSMLEPKQIKMLLKLNIIWFYPQYAVLIFVIFLIFKENIASLFKKEVIFKNSNRDIIIICYLFSCIYILSTLLNLNKSYDVLFSLRGLCRVLLQYVFFVSLIMVLVDNFPEVTVRILKYIFILSSIVIVFVLIGIFGYVTGFDLLPVQEIVNGQIISQSWVKVLNFVLFLPKFGGVFPETQALGLFLLMSYICYVLLKKCDVTFNKVLHWYGRLLPIFSILTFSKTVIPAVGIFLIWNNYESKKCIKSKLLLSLLFFVSFYLLLINPYAGSVEEYYVYGTKVNLDDKVELVDETKNNEDNNGEITSIDETNSGMEGIQADSLGERTFHVVTFFNYARENILSFFIGMGPYNYGNYVRVINPAIFNKYTNAVSMFTVFIESGLVGFLIYLLLWGYMIAKSRSYLVKCALFSLLIGNIGQPNWSMDILLICILMIYSLDKYGRIFQKI